jgi:hypothetical protein
MSAKVCLKRHDASGSMLSLEVDPEDGRRYLTVAFDGVECPFELDPVAARDVGHALLMFAASWSGSPAVVEAVKQPAAVQRGIVEVPCTSVMCMKHKRTRCDGGQGGAPYR